MFWPVAVQHGKPGRPGAGALSLKAFILTCP